MDDREYGNQPHDLAALEHARKAAVAQAAFWSAFADAAKKVYEAARAEAIAEAGRQRQEKVTATGTGGKLGTLTRSEDRGAYVVASLADLVPYFQKTYPDWIEETGGYYEPQRWVEKTTLPKRDKLEEWLAALPEADEDGVITDPETGVDVTAMVRWAVKEGTWRLTTDKAAKTRTLEALKLMKESGVPMPAEARRMIEGGR